MESLQRAHVRCEQVRSWGGSASDGNPRAYPALKMTNGELPRVRERRRAFVRRAGAESMTKSWRRSQIRHLDRTRADSCDTALRHDACLRRNSS